MRKLLLVAVSISTLLTGHASAQVAVFDGTQAVNAVKSYFQDLKAFAQQLKSYETQLQQYLQEFQTAQQALVIAQGIVHDPTNFGAYLSLGNLAGVNLQSMLPVNPYSLMALTSGYSGIGIGSMLGKLSNLTSLVNTNVGVNAINICSAHTFACQLQTQRQYAAAGQQAGAQQVMQDMNNHMIALTALKARCLTSPDTKDSTDCGNQIAIEQAAIATDTAQLQAINSMATAQQNVFDNRASEWIHGQGAVSQTQITALPGGGG